ncbi:UDP-4-amino-4,6-dideoxy-N-acetyl-beta-L-altrosamine transaminase [Halobacillus karajensis]|uniref:UDP-4-amino-4-deoxy-L-arabinose--oxoglutarate aminotransferase n=1 Tax=Halobacillus karajensis TaxID=195088 RepID=A0A024P495_9BACI|nr:UDP-4-amino-4,6-dideoxy-N-acetyl-beta-L-altrosamine transaminase [Halobacillus karajensis]CDQ20646.1 UDP-4-amino-4-deoxy-L-arabinose--oxoglutarate aminotransferase [Halobacillus karajensis]CDQ23884.1 UDP-4-amino-4-deoxy-L-arabinose--oxoglutarate aminotransferase [Halobacillus karajensis]CDQ27362.1 UDP-4-amino-4-deoxy-L-arabinose--oxoglutarate aminotransferase [Halobacillus karajensis]
MGDTLAIFGGDPVRDTLLPYGRQSIDDQDIESVVAALQSDYITTGPEIDAFEKGLADYVGASYAVAFSNGTAALHAACFAAGITNGDEVITTPLTFVASANCVLYTGGKPVFADVNPKTYNIEPSSIESLITPRTKAIIPVDFTGQPADYDQIKAIADKYRLVIIEDAAHALGAGYKGKKVGSYSDMTMFSFHPVKHITTGEGGVITTNNRKYYEKLMMFRTHGITRDPAKLLEKRHPWEYEMQFLGFNYRMTDLQAALGSSQLKKLDSFVAKRKAYVKAYNQSFRKMENILTPTQLPGTDSSYHLYVIRLSGPLKGLRKEVFEALRAENIGVNVHYMPVHTQPYYKNRGYTKGMCPVAEKVYEQIISLPLFPGMTDEDAADVVKAVKKVMAYYEADAGGEG